MNFFNHTATRKKWMAIAGLIWLSYLGFHLLSLLNFHSGKTAFNEFYQWFSQTPFYGFMVVLLIATLSFHVITAVSRQLSNNSSAGTRYQKKYPEAIPRVAAWGGAATLFAFIVFHFVQMTLLIDKADLYQSMVAYVFQSNNVGCLRTGFVNFRCTPTPRINQCIADIWSIVQASSWCCHCHCGSYYC